MEVLNTNLTIYSRLLYLYEKHGRQLFRSKCIKGVFLTKIYILVSFNSYIYSDLSSKHNIGHVVRLMISTLLPLYTKWPNSFTSIIYRVQVSAVKWLY